MSKEGSFELEAGALAFGDGSHPTTRQAMEVLQELAEETTFSNVLDIGCGSGLLGMMAATLWPDARVLATDIEAQAVEATKANAARNGLAGRIHAARSDGYRAAAIIEAAPYDLILCNMTADPILAMAKEAAAMLAKDGLLVLSGLLAWRKDEVVAVYAQAGLALVAAPIEGGGGWVSLLLGHE